MDFQQSIKISLQDLLPTPQLQEEEKCSCHLFQIKKKNSKHGAFLIPSRDKLRSYLQSDSVINRRYNKIIIIFIEDINFTDK